MTAGLVTILTIYAFITKTDFTVCMSAIWILVGVMLLVGIFMFIFRDCKALHLVYCGLGLIIFSIYLLIDVQLILANKRYGLSIDDYIIGVLILYIDIIMIFMYILSLLSRK